MKKFLFSFFLLVCFSYFNSQTTPLNVLDTAPANTRLFQVNTSKGSALSLVESSENSIYHIGTLNASEVGFDGLAASSVGVNDLFILKSAVATGNNAWFKTFSAGSGGSIFPRYVYVDAMENLYLFANFNGTVTVGSNTINSTSPDNAFLMKIDSSGNPVWVNWLGNASTAFNIKNKCVTDGIDTFFFYNDSSIVRINDVTGNTIHTTAISGVVLKSIALNSSNLYASGITQAPNVNEGSGVIPNSNTGFILKGDKNANFSVSATTSVNSIVSDISFNSEGNLIVAGFSNGSTNILTQNGSYAYTYNPNANIDTNNLYNYVAKIDSNLQNVYFLRTSSPIGFNQIYLARTAQINGDIKPYGSDGSFNMIISNTVNAYNSFTNVNATNSVLYTDYNQNSYKLLLKLDSVGNYFAGNQPDSYGFITSSGLNNYSLTSAANRLFSTKVYNALDGNLLWTKQKLNSDGGNFSRQFSSHLNSSKNDVFVSVLVEGSANFFGKQINNLGGTYTRNITRLGEDGLPKWFASFGLDSGRGELNVSGDIASVDKDDNLIFIANSNESTIASFTDSKGRVVSFPHTYGYYDKIMIKVDKDGAYLWSKDLYNAFQTTSSIRTDGNGDVYLLSTGGYTINNQTLSGVSLLKLSGDGDFVYGKSYANVDAFSLVPAFDAQNNLYVFTEPINYTGNNYVFDGITIPTNASHTDFLMLKFNSSGDVIWGKNFYANAPNYNYAWPNDIVFDGQDFVVMGNYLAAKNTDYTGLDLVNIPRIYPVASYVPYFAKVTTSGSVLWQKAFQSSTGVPGTGNYTNINLDENKNIYMYYFAKDKVSVDGAEYSFDAINGNKILSKLDSSGNLKYLKALDGAPYGTNFIDVISDDLLNVTGFTNQNNFLNYPLNFNGASCMYVATFGDLMSYYLTPSKDYLALNSVAIDNNSGSSNTFSFDLINNVDWNAASDQSWLNLSFLSLTGRNIFKNNINGNGDSKIIMNADANTSGTTRTANLIVSGTNVSPKTISITQTGTLATGESKTFTTVLYPNPTSDFLNIQSQQKISKIEIYDLSGKLLKVSTGKDNKVSVSSFAKGMYLIKIYTDNGVVNSKFIKN